MQRSSSSIANLAAALAKAQVELVNPEKSQQATIRADGPENSGRSFRYAPLSSGLEIVRKALGQHEIATLQTTAVDQTTGTIGLTTVLAHSSGEWIASDWPICAISELAHPHRLGSALTYARRYGLFTLVGIAGEDDLDAPDLPMPTNQSSTAEKQNGRGIGHLNSRLAPKGRAPVRQKIFGLDESTALGDRLVAELDALGSAEDAAIWAHRSLPDKNSLMENDARRVEEAFRTRLATVATTSGEAGQTVKKTAQSKPLTRISPGPAEKRLQSTGVDKSALIFPEPRRVRDREHIRFVAAQPCLVCGRRPADPHHLRFAQPRALSLKVSDEFTVPLCRGHHRELHRCGDEGRWWSKAGLDPLMTARAMWLQSHPLLAGHSGPLHNAAHNAAEAADNGTAPKATA